MKKAMRHELEVVTEDHYTFHAASPKEKRINRANRTYGHNTANVCDAMKLAAKKPRITRKRRSRRLTAQQVRDRADAAFEAGHIKKWLRYRQTRPDAFVKPAAREERPHEKPLPETKAAGHETLRDFIKRDEDRRADYQRELDKWRAECTRRYRIKRAADEAFDAGQFKKWVAAREQHPECWQDMPEQPEEPTPEDTREEAEANIER